MTPNGGITGSLFDLLDQGASFSATAGLRVFPVWSPYNRRLGEEFPGVGERVLLRMKQNRSGKMVPVFARKRVVKGFEGYGFYRIAVLQSKKALVGKKIKSPDGSLEYTISEADFKVQFIKGAT